MPSQELINIIIKAQDQASSTAKKVDDNLKKIGESTSRLGNIPGMDTMRNKLSNVASTIDTKFGGALTRARGHFTNFKNNVGGVANSVRSKFGGAVDGVRNKLTGLSNGGKGLASSMSFLKGAVSMTAGMIGFELAGAVVEAGRSAINARGQLDYFGQRLQNMSGQTKLSAQGFTQLKSQISDLQKEFRKVDMTAVGATAEEIAVKMQLPADKIGDLTRMTAVLSSTFVKEGRTQEDAVLAVGDALDGQFKRLQEIGITQDKLKENGWNGNLEDQASLIDSLNKTMQEMGYEQTAKDITTLDEAFTALSVAGGNLLADILIPITPAMISIMNAVMSAMDGVKPFIQALQGAKLPGWLQDVGWATALAIGIGVVGTYIQATLIPALAEAALAAWGFASAMLANPLTWIAVALAAVALAVYEVGKAFGWWTDVQSMLGAVWAGIQRLWSAFINHPDVQAAIQTIMAAWDWLSSAIGHAWEAILKFFNVSTGGEFDIVRALIEGIGTAWNIITAPIRVVIDLVQRVIKFFQGLAPAVNGAWSAISNAIAPYVNIIRNTIGALIDIFNRFRSGQLDLPTAIIGALKVLWTAYMSILKRISTLALRFASQMWNNAVKAGSNFVKGIVTHIKTLAGKVLSHINKTLSNIRNGMAEWIRTGAQRISDFIRAIIDRIRNLPSRFHDFLVSVLHGIQSVGQSWINTAKNRASSLVNGVIGYIKGLPGKVGAGLRAVISTITGGINAWITNAKTYVSSLISAITSPFSNIPETISSALSGVVSAITTPFRNAYNSVKPIIDTISSASSTISGLLGRGPAGGDIVGGHDYGNYYGNLGGTLTRRKVSSTTGSKSDKVKGELDVNLNFTGLPSNINEKTLVKALSSKKVIDSLVKNKDFQNLDLQVKTKMASKNKRARGA